VSADSADQRRVTATGTWDDRHQLFWRGQSFEGTPGVDFVTPLKLADGSAVLVDRGWAYAPDGYHVDSAFHPTDPPTVRGLALRAPRGRGDVDPTRLADSLGRPLLPFVIQALPESGQRAPQGLVRWPMAVLDDGPHLSYAIQWFSFSIIIVVGTIALLRRRNVQREGVERPDV
jgi:surfeit locus 1 family protein